MPKLTMQVTDRQDMFGQGLHGRLQGFLKAEKESRTIGAKAAASTTRASFKYRRDIIPPRRGRSGTGGQMGSHLKWRVLPDGVEFNVELADREAPHWIIQEIGTGRRATMKRGGAENANPVGRPRKGATYVRTVKSQKGRRISAGLVFATGGRYSPPGQRKTEQLYWASTIKGVPRRTRQNPRGQAAAIRIQKEIEGQHFVRKGAQEGFRQYKRSVLAAARQHFAKGYRP